MFYNIRNTINNKLARTIYFSCIYSRIKYGIEIYGSACDAKIAKLQTLQNKLMKLLTKKPPRFSTDRLHSELNILRVKDIYETSVLHFTYNCVNGNTIENFRNFHHFQQDVHTHNTRQKKHLTRKRIHTDIGKSTIHYTGASLWNSMTLDISNIKTLKSFKRNLFKHYLNKYSLQ